MFKVKPKGRKEIKIDSQCEFITAYAFRKCVNKLTVEIPDSVKNIADKAFGDNSACKNKTIKANKGSYAEEYARQKNIKFEEI